MHYGETILAKIRKLEKTKIKWPDDGRSISRNVASLNILVHDVINLLYYVLFIFVTKKIKA